MRICINRKFYNCNENAITLLRFRNFFGYSFLNQYIKKKEDEFELWVKLLYIAIHDFNIPFSEFEKDCAADNDFLSVAFIFRESLFARDSEQEPRRQDRDEEQKFDEYTIVAQLGICGLGMQPMYEMGIFQVMAVINEWVKIKSPPGPKVLNGREAKMALGISKEDEEEIKKYMELNGQAKNG